MGCGKSSLNPICLPEITRYNLFNINIEPCQTYDYSYLTYCIKCDILGINKKIIHCDIYDRCHDIIKYIHCNICNVCLDPHSDYDTIRHRKLHKKL